MILENIETEVRHLSARGVVDRDTVCSECLVIQQVLGKGGLPRDGEVLDMAKPLSFLFLIPVRLYLLRKLRLVKSLCT